MKRLLCFAILGGSSLAHAADVTGTGTLTSDYVWRGTSQTRGDPALQAGVRIAGTSGLYASAWGSNVAFGAGSDARTELDLALGWSHALPRDWTIDLNVLQYRYPSTTVDLDWTEANGTLTWAGHAWLSLGWSPEALGGTHAGLYAHLGGRLPVNDRVNLEATVARYFLHERDYQHVQVSAVVALGEAFALRVTGHDTDQGAAAIFGDDVAGARVEVALQASF